VNGTSGGWQFMVGGDLLVAPQYKPLGGGGDARDGIYLPANPGGWVDYWTGQPYGDASGQAPALVNGYATPLETLPLFVRAGAIVPLWPVGQLPRAYSPAPAPAPSTLVLDLYPEGQSAFELYEDDGVTRQALVPDASKQAASRTLISVSAETNAMTKGGSVNVTVGAAAGAGFAGQRASRAYDVRIHRKAAPPTSVTLTTTTTSGATTLPPLNSLDALRFAAAQPGTAGGWCDVVVG
jgi:alpha-glucosidase